MTPDGPPGVPVLDLRGGGAPAPGAVLADPSGRRARNLGRIGKAIGALFLLWFVCLVLAGLGLLPSSGVPLASSVKPSGPRGLARIPAPAQPSAEDLRAAAPIAASAAATRRIANAAPVRVSRVTPPQRSAPTHSTTKGAAKHSAAPTAAPAPVLPNAKPVNPVAATAPGHSKTTTPGHSGAASGGTQNPHTSTAPSAGSAAPARGNSGASPGQTRTTTTGHGPPR